MNILESACPPVVSGGSSLRSSVSPERKKRILGIDPGTATVGFGVLDWHGSDAFSYISSGVITTSKHLSTGERLKIIREDLLSLIDEYQPDQAGVEALFFFKNAKTLVPVAQARGVILECFATRGIGIGEYTPMQVKQQVTGYGKATKEDVQWAVAKLLKLEKVIKPDDASDALAIALSHARMSLILTSAASV